MVNERHVWQTYKSLLSPNPRRNRTWRAAAMPNLLIYIKAPLVAVDMLLIRRLSCFDRMV
jgi:hypothetical protein